MAQLVEQLLPTPETSAKFYLPFVHFNRKDQNKEKNAGNGPSLKKLQETQASKAFGNSILTVVYLRSNFNHIGYLMKLLILLQFLINIFLKSLFNYYEEFRKFQKTINF